MIRTMIRKCLFLLVLATTLCSGAAFAEEAGFTVSRLVVGAGVTDLEPVGVADSFPASTEQVYCFLEAADITRDMPVVFVWLHEGNETARVEMKVKAGPRWRTYSSKLLGGKAGSWSVRLEDAGGAVLNSVSFTVE